MAHHAAIMHMTSCLVIIHVSLRLSVRKESMLGVKHSVLSRHNQHVWSLRCEHGGCLPGEETHASVRITMATDCVHSFCHMAVPGWIWSFVPPCRRHRLHQWPLGILHFPGESRCEPSRIRVWILGHSYRWGCTVFSPPADAPLLHTVNSQPCRIIRQTDVRALRYYRIIAQLLCMRKPQTIRRIES